MILGRCFILSFYSLVSLIFKEWSDFQGGYCYCFMFMILICMPFVFHRLTTNPCAQTNGVSDPTVAGTSSGSRVSYFPRLCDFNLLCESVVHQRVYIPTTSDRTSLDKALTSSDSARTILYESNMHGNVRETDTE